MFVLWLLLAAIVEFGRLLMVAQTLQLAARAGARQLALDDSLAAEAPFEDALARVFDPQWLVLDLDLLEQCGALLPETVAEESEDPLDRFVRKRLPLLNQQLRPVMFLETVPPEADPRGIPRRLLRYPGTLLARTAPPSDPCASEFGVAIPALEDERGAARQRVRWLPIVESPRDPTGGDRFPLSGGGFAALRIHYPHQALFWSAAYLSPPGPEGRGNVGDRIGEKPIEEINPLDRDGALLDSRDALAGPYGGRFGAGVQAILRERVRPYARVLRGEAVFPREVAGL